MKNSFKDNLLRFSNKYKKWIVLGAAFSFIQMLCHLAVANILNKIMDRTFSADGSFSYQLTLLIVVIFIGGFFVNYSRIYCIGYYGSKIVRDIRNASIVHINKLSIGDLQKSHSGDLIAKLTSDIDNIQKFIEDSFSDLFYIPTLIVGCCTYMLYINWQLFLSCFWVLPILVPISIIGMKPIKARSRKYIGLLGKTNNNVQDLVRGISIIKAYNSQEEIYEKYKGQLDEALEMALENDKKQYLLEPISHMINHLPVVICLVYGGYLCIAGSMSIGELAAFLSLLKLIITPLVRGYFIYINSKSASVSMERLFSILNQEVETDLVEDKEKMSIVNNFAFSIQGLNFSHHAKESILKDLSLNMQVGKKIAVVGESGCGKSTLLKLLCGFYPLSSGAIYFRGIDISNMPKSMLRDEIAYVPQEAYLFPLSIYENIKLGNEKASKEQVFQAARLACAHDFTMELPQGYETIVGEYGSTLSGGQAQRIALARALLKDAPILILDEATSALDEKTEKEVMGSLDQLRGNKTIIIVAHRLTTVKNADEIIVLDKGKVIEQGSHDRLIRQNGSYTSFYNKLYAEDALGGSTYAF